MSKYLLIFLFICTSADAEGLGFGRLFSTPSERANLDYLRQTTRAKVLLENAAEVEEAPETPSSVSMQGYVKRSDGKKSTVWINNTPVQEGANSADVQVGRIMPNTNIVPVIVTGSGRTVGLKAGQVYVPDTDQVLEAGVHAKEQAKNKLAADAEAEEIEQAEEPQPRTHRGRLR